MIFGAMENITIWPNIGVFGDAIDPADSLIVVYMIGVWEVRARGVPAAGRHACGNGYNLCRVRSPDTKSMSA